MSGGSSAPATQTTTSKSEPWAGAQPYLKDVMQKGQQMFESGMGRSYYPFSTVVPFSNQTNQAFSMMGNQAMGSQGLFNQALGEVGKNLNGDYYNSNPYLDSTWNTMAGRIEDQVNSSAAARGRVGSGAHQTLMTRNLGELANDIYGQNYRDERANQIGAIGMLPGAYEASLAPGKTFGVIGSAMEGKAGETLQDYMSRWDWEQNRARELLDAYSQQVVGTAGLGSTNTRTEPNPNAQQGSPWGGLIGGALSLGSLFL